MVKVLSPSELRCWVLFCLEERIDRILVNQSKHKCVMWQFNCHDPITSTIEIDSGKEDGKTSMVKVFSPFEFGCWALSFSEERDLTVYWSIKASTSVQYDNVMFLAKLQLIFLWQFPTFSIHFRDFRKLCLDFFQSRIMLEVEKGSRKDMLWKWRNLNVKEKQNSNCCIWPALVNLTMFQIDA